MREICESATPSAMNRNSRRVRTRRREELHAGSSTSSRSAKGSTGVFPEDASVQKRYQSRSARTCQGRCQSKSGELTHRSKTKQTPNSAVAKEMKQYSDPDLFSSTLPVEMLRYIASRAATEK